VCGSGRTCLSMYASSTLEPDVAQGGSIGVCVLD
jgi:hypothetical protein